jgi:hypothetical protein
MGEVCYKHNPSLCSLRDRCILILLGVDINHWFGVCVHTKSAITQGIRHITLVRGKSIAMLHVTCACEQVVDCCCWQFDCDHRRVNTTTRTNLRICNAHSSLSLSLSALSFLLVYSSGHTTQLLFAALMLVALALFVLRARTYRYRDERAARDDEDDSDEGKTLTTTAQQE